MYGVGLVQPKFPENVGSVLRAAYNFNADLVAVTGKRTSPRVATNTPRAHRHIPYLRCADIFDAIPYGCIPIAIDLVKSAKDIRDFKHPEKAFYIFGPEDGTLGPSIVDRCKYTIYIPTTQCMNLAGTVHIVLYDRLLKGAYNVSQGDFRFR